MDERRDKLHIADSVRIIVDEHDGEVIRGTFRDVRYGSVVCVPYVYAVPDDAAQGEGSLDWTYLRDVITPGMQLNLVVPRLTPHRNGSGEQTAYPDLIIVEPDYLVDISAIAGCFEIYGATPLAYLLNKIRPSQKTSAIALGNFASQLLDEEVNDSVTPSYEKSAQTFFKNNAMSIITTRGMGPDFHRDALAQRDNIRRAVREILPAEVEDFAVDDVMLEPSFFSEMLGLQGRMDFLTIDHRLLLEQKAGKCAFPQPTHLEERPSYQEKHYVQMLLYMALLRYNHGDTDIQSYLLYSKYHTPLVGMGYDSHLVFEAIRVRNGIVGNELLFAHDDVALLDRLLPENLNVKKISGKLWNNYLQPQINELLAPLQNAMWLDRMYVYRMLAFVQQEHILAKLGNATEENPGFAGKWRMTLEQKKLAGIICDQLTLLPVELNYEGKVETVTLSDASHDGCRPVFASANFRVGDIVILYPYDKDSEPDCRTTMVFRCSIKEIGRTHMTLTMRTPQKGDKVFRREEGRQWAIEHDFFESSFTSLYRGTYAFLSATRERRALILMRNKPKTDTRKTLKGDYGAFNAMALRVKQACDLFLIIGPPGTGKTSFGMLYTLREELLEPDSSVIVMAYTNRAVDEICSKLMESGIDFIRLGSRMSCSEVYHDYLLDTTMQGCDNVKQLRDIVEHQRVFVGTTTAFNSSNDIFSLRTFSLAIIDEASQILEPHLLGLLSATHDGESAIRKFVMIGDHKQLPTVVQQDTAHSHVDNEHLNKIGLTDCRLSLFERLLLRYHNDPSVVYMLTRQGRMHDDIALFTNENFYAGKLCSVPLPHQTEPTVVDGNRIHRRVLFLDVQPDENAYVDKVNEREAAVIAALVNEIYEDCQQRVQDGGEEVCPFDPATTVGIIVPYRNQIAAVRDALAKYDVPELQDITIDTVERYQGSQRDNIIYGFTVSKQYQLKFLTSTTFEEDGHTIDRKLNVALTRARGHLFIVGYAQLISEVPLFARLIDFCKERDSYMLV